ncbi:MAG TPA: hypothetical protein VKR06_31975 [Ktedonosporobacter sp.]|nr:hypothetical protein [Ktedonosporobacter sp.]
MWRRLKPPVARPESRSIWTRQPTRCIQICAWPSTAAQEALTNIRKHAHATKVLLRLSTRDGQVERASAGQRPGAPRRSTSNKRLASAGRNARARRTPEWAAIGWTPTQGRLAC